MIKYPASIDASLELPTVIDNVTSINGALLNNIRDAILAMENELGIKPSGIYTNVRTRIAAIEVVVGNLQIISLTQDLGGTLLLPKVVGLQGTALASANINPIPRYKLSCEDNTGLRHYWVDVSISLTRAPPGFTYVSATFVNEGKF